MQAIRPVHEQEHEQRQQGDATRPESGGQAYHGQQLPPPPAPFPVDLLGSSKVENVDSTKISQHISSVQQACVNGLTALLPADCGVVSSDDRLSGTDAQLAAALIELLEVTYELEGFLLFSSSQLSPPRPLPQLLEGDNNDSRHRPFDDLANRLRELQNVHASGGNTDAAAQGRQDARKQMLHPAISVVREQLAWARLESLSSAVQQLVYARDERGVASSLGLNGGDGRDDVDCLPPSYSYDQHHSNESEHTLPSYRDIEPNGDGHVTTADTEDEKGRTASEADTKSEASVQAHTTRASHPAYPTSSREKMLQDLEAVSDAIERLYSVAPQLNDQRSEPRPSSSSSGASQMAGKDRAQSKAELERQKMKELEEIWDRIERAHGKRRMAGENGQRADGEQLELRRRERFLNRLIEQAESSRLSGQDAVMNAVDAELARARDLRDRDHFLRDLMEQSGNRRLDNQDADAPNTDEQQSALMKDIIARSRASRMSEQGFPLSAEDKLQASKDTFIDGLVTFGQSGRMTDQDSHPPIPRVLTKTETAQGEKDPFELITAHDFLVGMRANHADGYDRDQPIQQAQTLKASSRSNSTPLLDHDGQGQNKRASASSSAFQKLAGMVRRGSVQLGLKSDEDSVATVDPHNALDTSDLAYVAEHQENLRVVQIMLHGANVPSYTDLDMTITGPTNVAITSKRDTSLNLPLSLPTPVVQSESVILTPQSSYIEGKIPAFPTPAAPASLNTSLTYALSASELRRQKPIALCCTSCDRELADVSLASREGEYEAGRGYKDLPSEHWAEMMEVWMCHADPGFTARLAERTKEGFWPRDGCVLVGGSYLLVQGDKIKKSNLVFSSGTEADSAWHTASCLCGEAVGKIRTDDYKRGAGTMRFSKWAIALLRSVHDQEDGEESVEPVRYPLSVFVVSDMLELAQAHASYRFVITNEDGQPQIYIWLFNPSIRIAYRAPTLSQSHSVSSPGSEDAEKKAQAQAQAQTQDRRSSIPRIATKSDGNGTTDRPSTDHGVRGENSSSHSPGMGECKVLRAAKVMYKVGSADTKSKSERERTRSNANANADADADSVHGASPFGQNVQVETLSYTQQVCERLLATLKESSAVYPEGRRTMGVFNIGFLERT